MHIFSHIFALMMKQLETHARNWTHLPQQGNLIPRIQDPVRSVSYLPFCSDPDPGNVK